MCSITYIYLSRSKGFRKSICSDIDNVGHNQNENFRDTCFQKYSEMIFLELKLCKRVPRFNFNLTDYLVLVVKLKYQQ